MSGKGRSFWDLYWRALREARPYRFHLLVMLGLSLLSTPLSLLSPLPLKVAVDSVIGDDPLPSFLAPLAPDGLASSGGVVFVMVLALVIALLHQLRGLASTVLKTYTGQRLVLDLRARLFHHAQRLSLSYHDIKGTSDSTYRVHYDADEVKSLAISGLIPFVTSTVKLVAMVYVIARIDMQLASVALVIAPLLFLLLRSYRDRLRHGWRAVKKLDSSIMSLVQETLGQVRLVKAFGQEDRERDRLVDRSGQKLRARVRLSLLEGLLGVVIGLMVASGTAVVLFIGVSHVQQGVLSLGSLLLVMSYISQLYSPLEKISEKIGEVQSTLVSAERAFALLDEKPEVHESKKARTLRRARGAVTFENVSFGYGRSELVLHNVSFEVASGERVGIAGTTGAGKTTLISLLMRFYDPCEGRILLDGIDLRALKLAHLRNQFALVLQEPLLFSTSIGENIAYARPDARYHEIVAAAKAAGAHDFIGTLPDAYDTKVGERGMRLSGGERQRISLARAFLKDAPMLLLDEPTSSVDVNTEAAILEAMDQLMRGRTAFMIAHRLSTLEHCTIRLQIERGRLAGPTSAKVS